MYDKYNNTYKSMLCFTDISSRILYDTSKAEGELLTLINSTISHEMRNPLNSIINQCAIMESLSYQFENIIDEVKTLIFEDQKSDLLDVYNEFKNSTRV